MNVPDAERGSATALRSMTHCCSMQRLAANRKPAKFDTVTRKVAVTRKGLPCLQSSSSFLVALLLSTLPVWAQDHKSAKAPATADWKDVDAAMGRAGQDQPDGHTQVRAAAQGYERYSGRRPDRRPAWRLDRGWHSKRHRKGTPWQWETLCLLKMKWPR